MRSPAENRKAVLTAARYLVKVEGAYPSVRRVANIAGLGHLSAFASQSSSARRANQPSQVVMSPIGRLLGMEEAVSRGRVGALERCARHVTAATNEQRAQVAGWADAADDRPASSRPKGGDPGGGKVEVGRGKKARREQHIDHVRPVENVRALAVGGREHVDGAGAGVVRHDAPSARFASSTDARSRHPSSRRGQQ